MLAHQDRVLSRLLSTPLPTTILSPYRLPGRIAPYLRCWGDSMRKQENLYETVSWECSEQNEVHLSRSHTTGTLRFRHELITSDKLNRFRFYGLYKQFFENEPHGMRGSREDVGRFTCTTTFVAPETLTLKVVVCLRAYKKLPGLYDAVLKAATLDGDTRGAQTTLTLGGRERGERRKVRPSLPGKRLVGPLTDGIVVEILDRAGSVRARSRHDRFPVRIGRGYDNDVIVEDEYVSPSHLAIERDEAGALRAMDLPREHQRAVRRAIAFERRGRVVGIRHAAPDRPDVAADPYVRARGHPGRRGSPPLPRRPAGPRQCLDLRGDGPAHGRRVAPRRVLGDLTRPKFALLLLGPIAVVAARWLVGTIGAGFLAVGLLLAARRGDAPADDLGSALLGAIAVSGLTIPFGWLLLFTGRDEWQGSGFPLGWLPDWIQDAFFYGLLGTWYRSNQAFRGAVDDVRLYTRALTEDEVRASATRRR